MVLFGSAPHEHRSEPVEVGLLEIVVVSMSQITTKMPMRV